MDRFCQLSPSLKTSRILTGLWQVADMEKEGNTLDPNATADFMAPYVDAGFTTFDMADHYGSAEVIAGAFHANSPQGKKAQFLTKWVPKPGKITKEDVKEAVEKAKVRLQTEKIDLLQYHAWDYTDPIWLDTLFWLEELKEEGHIGDLGVTNFDAGHLRIACASGIKLVSNQVSYSLLDQRAAGELAEVCERYDVKILAFGTLAGGLLSEKWFDQPDQMPDQMPSWSLMKYRRFIESAGGWPKFQELLKSLKEIADENNVSIPNVATRYILEDPNVGGVIIGARLGESEHISNNLQLFNFHLSDQNRKKIGQCIKQFDSIPGGCGDEYRKPPFLTASGDLSHHLDSIPLPYDAVEVSKGRKKVLTGTVWEDIAGYCRAVRMGDRILVSGTTATHGDRQIGGNDPKAQAHFILDKIEGAIRSLGGSIEDVVRTRIFVSDANHWEPVSRAHGERFRTIQPANTLVEAKLIGDGYLVEIEAEAIVM